MKFILTATRKSDTSKLQLINRYTLNHPFVVCWNYSHTTETWDWGTYCNDLKEALSVFNAKVIEHSFDEVVEKQPDNETFEFDRLCSHAGHEIEIATYGNDYNVSIECIDCHEVLHSLDNPKYAEMGEVP